MSGRPKPIEEVMDRHLAYLEHRRELAFGRSRIPGMPGFLMASRSWRAGASDSPAEVRASQAVIHDEGNRGDGH
jgi:hypothetical protein